MGQAFFVWKRWRQCELFSVCFEGKICPSRGFPLHSVYNLEDSMLRDVCKARITNQSVLKVCCLFFLDNFYKLTKSPNETGETGLTFWVGLLSRVFHYHEAFVRREGLNELQLKDLFFQRYQKVCVQIIFLTLG